MAEDGPDEGGIDEETDVANGDREGHDAANGDGEAVETENSDGEAGEAEDGDGAAFEVERTGTRAEAAALLHDLADGVASGSVAFDDGAVVADLPETVDLEVEYEQEDDESEIEVELEWPTERAVDTDGAPQTEADDGANGASDVEEVDGADGGESGGHTIEGGEDDEIGIEASEIDTEGPAAVVESATETTVDDGTVDATESGAESGSGAGDVVEPDTETTDATESAVVGVVEPSEVARSRARFELYRDRAGKWRWRLVHHNGNIIADGGGGYARKANARKGLESVKRNAPGALVLEKE